MNKASVLTPGFSLDELKQFTDHIQIMIKLAIQIFENDKDDDNDMPPLDEAAA